VEPDDVETLLRQAQERVDAAEAERDAALCARNDLMRSLYCASPRRAQPAEMARIVRMNRVTVAGIVSPTSPR
jgi:hypothetical protein